MGPFVSSPVLIYAYVNLSHAAAAASSNALRLSPLLILPILNQVLSLFLYVEK
jgi:hypothetical protein